MNKSILFFALIVFLLFGNIPIQPVYAISFVEYLVIGGGGGGGGAGINTVGGGGGGAGQYQNGTGYSVTVQEYTITVGAGGAGGAGGAASGVTGSIGSNSTFATITSVGGGGGGGALTGTVLGGASGGNSGDGGNGGKVGDLNGVPGDDGNSSSITGSSITRGGGGGGGADGTCNGGAGCAGSAGGAGGGGGGGSSVTGSAGTAGTANTGGGGGGGAGNGAGGNGGSGVVIIRYLTSSEISATGGTITESGGYTIHTFNTSGIFDVDFIPPQLEFGDLVVENAGDAFSVSGTFTLDHSVLLNVTSIIHSVNGTMITTNSTGQNTTSYPITISFGPFWYLQTTDLLYNHTVTVNMQDETGNSSSTISDLLTREYDPSYFIAIDPSQGFVNYTFPDGNNFIHVNRDTNGTLFNIECQYFTQAQAFFNELETGVWDNKSNVLLYIGDSSDYYYIQCFNDGELFVTSIPQNFTNALVPGLVIFDELGGFFGAPSIILVILAILSLGTGRNYPIILLIAASVTGILLALELLVLDPGLVVALIVMAGIGIFGIRKFY